MEHTSKAVEIFTFTLSDCLCIFALNLFIEFDFFIRIKKKFKKDVIFNVKVGALARLKIK